MVRFFLHDFFRMTALLFFLAGVLPSSNARDSEIVIYAVGDSITWGQTYGTGEDYPRLLSDLFKERGIENVRVTNKGQSGYTVGDVLDSYSPSSLQRIISRTGLHYVLIMLGTNDTRIGDETPLEDYVQRLNQLIDLFLALSNEDGSHPQVILSLIPPHNSPKDGEYMASNFKDRFVYRDRIPNELNPAIQQIGEERGLLVVDNYTLLKEAGPDLLPDGLHPGKEGSEILAATFFQVLYPLIDRQSSVGHVFEYLK